MLKLKIFIVALVQFFVACNMHVPEQKKETKKVTFSAELGGWSKQDSIGTIFVRTTLYNDSPDTLTYLRMDCSWADSYATDNDSFNVSKTPCYKNGPMTMVLFPYTSEHDYIRLLTKTDIQTWRYSKLSIGYNFNLLDSTKDVIYNVSKLTDMQHIMWSDTLSLAEFWKR